MKISSAELLHGAWKGQCELCFSVRWFTRLVRFCLQLPFALAVFRCLRCYRLTLKTLKTPKTPYRARTAVGRRDKTAGCGQPLPPFSLVEQRSDSRLMERKAHIVFIVRQAELRS